MRFNIRLKTEFKAKKETLKIKDVRRALYDGLQEVADGMYDDMTTGELGALFSRNGVDFYARTRIRGTFGYAVLVTNSDLYNWLNYGTERRWAIMNNPFSPATAPGRLSATGGTRTFNRNGEYTRIRGKQAMMEAGLAPRPGIAARRWDEELIRKWESKAADILQEALNRGLGL
jgi:hypothetical protein